MGYVSHGYLYRITNPIGQVYIGQTADICKRRNDYKCIKKISSQKLIYKSIKHYGWENHKMDVIYRFWEKESDINEIERLFISFFNSYYYNNKNRGLNLTLGGQGNRGGKATAETRKKMSETHKERLKNPELRKKYSERMMGNTNWKNQTINPFKGKKHTEETKEKNRIAHIGKKASEETKKKMSEERKTRVYSDDFGRKISEGRKGMKFSEEHKRNISLAKKGIPLKKII